MEEELRKRNMVHVMTDSYGNDPHIPDAEFIAATMLRCATHGSILVVHMPEKGFREWDLDAIRLVLKGLDQRGLRSVTLSELARRAQSDMRRDYVYIATAAARAKKKNRDIKKRGAQVTQVS